MSGPRVTSGADSKQDYGTPENLLTAIAHSFGPIQFDLAAHAANHKHARYFAPTELVETYDPERGVAEQVAFALLSAGGDAGEIEAAVRAASAQVVATGKAVAVRVKNHDPNAYALDAFAHDWSALRNMDPTAIGRWLLFLNCEFSDCEPWAEKFLMEARRGADGVLLTPAALGSRWCLRHILGKADVYELRERPSFDGRFPFPKDCMVTHFWPGMTGARHLWDWKRDRLLMSWAMVPELAPAEPATRDRGHAVMIEDPQRRLFG